MSNQRSPAKKFKVPLKKPRISGKGPAVTKVSEQNVKSIHDLPDEMLLQIFSRLSHEERAKSVTKVCKRWLSLHRDPSLYRKFTFTSDDPASTEYALNLLKRAPWLNTLCLIDRLDTNRLLEQVVLSQKRIKRLDFKGCSGDRTRDYIKFKLQKQILKRCKRLQHLKVKHSFFSKKFFEGIGASLPQLKNIQFDSTKKSNTEAIRGIIKHCENLEEFRAFAVFDDPNFGRTTNEDILCLSKKSGNSLTVLKLNGAEWTNIAFEYLSRCHNLKRLHIYHMENLSDYGIFKLINMRQLQFLALVRCRHVSSQAWVALFKSETMKSLKSVNLAMCSNVTDEVVQTIGKRLSELQRIRLTGCTDVTDVGFLDLIVGCSQLIFLNAYLMNPVVSKVFPLIPLHSPNLRTLIFDPVEVNSELGDILEEVFDKLPNLSFRVGNTCWKGYTI